MALSRQNGLTMMRRNRCLIAATATLAAIALSAPVRAASDESIVYVVRSRDTIWDLSARYMIGAAPWREVVAINRLRDPRRMPTGFRLSIPRRLLRSVPIELRILTFSGTVGIGPDAAAPVRGQVLAEGTALRTGANAFVTIAGSDGSRLSLPSNSAVRIGRSRRYLINEGGDIEIEVLTGRAEVIAAPQRAQDRFRARTPVTVSAVRGTVYRVAFDAARDAAGTEVLEGLVSVETPRTAAAVAAGFGAAAGRDGAIATETLLPAPPAIDPGRVQTDPEVTFTMRPVGGAVSYRTQVARDGGFRDMVSEQETAIPEARFTGVANGRYFLRTTATAASGLEGQPETVTFRRQQVGLRATQQPGALADSLRFEWVAEGEGTSTFRFQLLPGDPASPAPALIDEPGMADNGITLTGLAPGAYRWRVGVTQVTPDGSAQVWTPFQTFTVSN